MEGLFFGAGCTLAFIVILLFAPEVSPRVILCIKADMSRQRGELWKNLTKCFSKE
jgi:hypothetical protein